MDKKKIIDLEKYFMYLSEKYGFNTTDHNNCYDLISNILDDISLDEFLTTKKLKENIK